MPSKDGEREGRKGEGRGEEGKKLEKREGRGNDREEKLKERTKAKDHEQ